MSFSIAASAAASSATLHALAGSASEPSARHAGSTLSAASAEDVPLCATPTPGHPPIPHGLGALLDRVALNPQPLPPKEAGGAAINAGKAAAYDDGGWCGTVPHKLPHFPPTPGPWADIVGAATAHAR